MASKNNAIKKAVKQLRALLKNLDESEKASPLLRNLVTSLTKQRVITFNKTLARLPFNKTLTVKAIGFNKTIHVKFNKAIAKVKFNKSVASLPFNKRSPV